MGVLDRIDSPQDLKDLSAAECVDLAGEIRAFLIDKVAATGGHLGPNLGVVELTLAIHRIFDSALDPATRSFHLRHDASWARMPAPEDWAESVDHQERSASLHAGFRDR